MRVFVVFVALMPLPLLGDVLEQEVVDILRALDDPGSVPIPFKEKRMNALLEEALELRGDIQIDAEGRLTKRILTPFEERVTLGGSRLEVERDGRKRRVRVGRLPGVADLYLALRALLQREPEKLLKVFRVAEFSAADNWRLELVARDADLAALIGRMELRGNTRRILSLKMNRSATNWQEMLFADPASL